MTPAARLTPLEPWIAAATGRRPLRREDLDRHQLQLLRATLALVRARSPFYRRLLAGVADPVTLDDVGRLPCTTPADLAGQGPRLVCVPQDEIARIVTLDTTGTTGIPKRVWFTAADQELTVDFFRAGMSTFTHPGDHVAILLPCDRPGGVGDLLAVALDRLGARPLRLGPVTDEAQAAAALRRTGVDVMVGVPVQVLALARRDPGLRPRAVLLSTDHVPRSLSAALERSWGTTVYGHYGMTETGLGCGVECEARRGYHLREADLLVEVVDPDDARPLPDGDEGEVLVTTLTRTGMPLLRYRTGDLGCFLPDRCPCGTVLRTLARVTRRLDGVVALDAGPLALADLDEALFALPHVLDFDATLVRAGPGTAPHRLEVAVRTAPGTGLPAEAVTAALAGVPVLARAGAAGALRLEATVGDHRAGTRGPRPAKRRLQVRDEHGTTTEGTRADA